MGSVGEGSRGRVFSVGVCRALDCLGWASLALECCALAGRVLKNLHNASVLKSHAVPSVV